MSTRKLRQVEGRRVLDEAARQRRLKKQLEALERDNHHDDPHQNVPQITHKLPSFSDGETSRKAPTLFRKVTHTCLHQGRRRKSKTEVRIKQVLSSRSECACMSVCLSALSVICSNVCHSGSIEY